MRDRRLPPQLNLILSSYKLLGGLRLLETDVSGLPIWSHLQVSSCPIRRPGI